MVSLAARSASRTAWSTVSRSTPGIEGTGPRALSPSMTNSGQIRSPVVSWFSRTMRRAQSLRRNRRSDWARRMVRENQLTTGDLIWPLFVMEGDNARGPVPSMPGVERLTVDQAVREAERAAKLTIPCLALFPYTDPSLRDETGSEALNPDNLVCRAIRAIKKEVPEVGLLCDVALDPFTSHGHDGLLRDGEILNDETVAVLVKQALVQAQAGCDIIAPSDLSLIHISAP